MNETKSPAARLAAEIQPLLPKGWRASEAIGLDMMGGSSPEFVSVHTSMPADCAWFGGRATAGARRKRRAVWRQNAMETADRIVQLITDNFTNVRAQQSGPTVYVYPLKEAK
jgi:hypothetical protein